MAEKSFFAVRYIKHQEPIDKSHLGKVGVACDAGECAYVTFVDNSCTYIRYENLELVTDIFTLRNNLY